MAIITRYILTLNIFIAFQVCAQQGESMVGNEQLKRLGHKLSICKNILLENKWVFLPEDFSLQKGDTSPHISAIKKNLFLIDYCSGNDTSEIFNDTLAITIKYIQKLYRIEATGLISPETVQLLNRLPEETVRKIEINIRRWDTFLSDTVRPLSELYLLANIPDFSLSVIDCDTTQLYMKAVFGKPSHKTPLMNGTLTYIVVNPSWVVPYKIAKNELLPLLKKGNKYLEKNHMKIYEKYDHKKREVDPDSIDWNAITEDNFSFTIEQMPGEWNALGQLKFLFPNNSNIYLHDTPEKYLFSRVVRAYSHGCIRLEKPVELATYLFFGNYLKANQNDISRMIQTNETNIYVRIPVPTPLFICYFSAWVDDHNKLQFREDIYGYDTLSGGK